MWNQGTSYSCLSMWSQRLKKGLGCESMVGRMLSALFWEIVTLLSKTLKLLLVSCPMPASLLSSSSWFSQMVCWMSWQTLGSQWTSTSSGSTMGLTVYVGLFYFLWQSWTFWSTEWLMCLSCGLRMCFWMCCYFSLILYSLPQTTQNTVLQTILDQQSRLADQQSKLGLRSNWG